MSALAFNIKNTQEAIRMVNGMKDRHFVPRLRGWKKDLGLWDTIKNGFVSTVTCLGGALGNDDYFKSIGVKSMSDDKDSRTYGVPMMNTPNGKVVEFSVAAYLFGQFTDSRPNKTVYHEENYFTMQLFLPISDSEWYDHGQSEKAVVLSRLHTHLDNLTKKVEKQLADEFVTKIKSLKVQHEFGTVDLSPVSI